MARQTSLSSSQAFARAFSPMILIFHILFTDTFKLILVTAQIHLLFIYSKKLQLNLKQNIIYRINNWVINPLTIECN